MAKRLGQHFLKDDAVLARAAASLNIKEGDIIIEIGPGHGELTGHILKYGPEKVIAIEKDKRLADNLRENLGLPNKSVDLAIVYGDALELLPEVIIEEKLSHLGYKIAGNIPYYITGYLLRVISELKNKPALTSLIIQEEVALRIKAISPKTNLLSASVQFWAEPRILEKIDAKKFRPAPKVNSALLILETKRKPYGVSPEIYYPFIKRLFKQPRKTILNNLSAGLSALEREEVKKKLINLKTGPTSRPGTLDILKIAELSSVLSPRK
ncbi:MAG: ribosomal RNA small subunit methyltransferase A [Patescibacteria group bacterium]|nr:ribosomal RNA small subunit methyltransferase A [Patescibacteria group bacterium]